MRQAYGLIQTEHGKTKIQRGSRPLGRETLTPKLPAQQIADFHLIRFRQVLQAVPADKFALSMRDNCPPAEVMFFPVDELTLDDSLHALHVRRISAGEILQDLRFVEDPMQRNVIR